jgi:hypothetical protein
MAEGRRVIRWTIPITAYNNAIRFNDDSGGHTSNQTITAGSYIVKGETGTGSPTDLLQTFVAKWNAAYLAMYGVAGTIVGTLSTTGFVTLSGAANIINLQATGTTFQIGLLGFTGTSLSLDSGETITGTYQASSSWYPDADHVRDSLEVPRGLFVKSISKRGRPSYIRHIAVGDDLNRRRIEWDDIIGARMSEPLLAKSDYAAVAGLAVSDPNASFQVLLEHVVNNGQVYVYDTNVPATHAEDGPYYVILPDEIVATGGVPFEFERQDLMQRRFGLSLEFVR